MITIKLQNVRLSLEIFAREERAGRLILAGNDVSGQPWAVYHAVKSEAHGLSLLRELGSPQSVWVTLLGFSSGKRSDGSPIRSRRWHAEGVVWPKGKEHDAWCAVEDLGVSLDKLTVDNMG